MTRRSKRVWIAVVKGSALGLATVVLPFALIFLAVDFGPVLQSYLAVTDVAREIGRRSAVAVAPDDSASAIALIEKRLAQNGLDPTKAIRTVSIRPGGWPGVSGDTVLVTIQYPYDLRTVQWLVSWTGVNATINLQTAMRFRHE